MPRRKNPVIANGLEWESETEFCNEENVNRQTFASKKASCGGDQNRAAEMILAMKEIKRLLEKL